MTFWEDKPASKQKNETITVKQNSTNTKSGTSTTNTTAPEWFKNSEEKYAKMYSNAPAVTGGGGSGGSGRSVNIGDKSYGYDTAPIMTAAQMSELMGGYNYDEGAIRALFDQATKAEYAAKRAANVGAQRQFATNMGEYITTLSDTMRQQLNQAVATGGSRGLAAAQAMQAAQDASLKTVDEATKLTEDAMALDFEEAAAYTQNAKDAEALRATRQQNMMNFILGRYDVDERTIVGAMSAAADAYGSKFYGAEAAKYNLEGTKYNADANKATEELVAKMQSDDNLKSIVANLINSGALTPNDTIAQMFGVAPGSLRNPPQNNYYSSGGYYGNGGSPTGTVDDGFDFNLASVRKSSSWFKQALMAEDPDRYIAAAESRGVSYKDALADYNEAKSGLWHRANEKDMTFDKYKAWIAQTYGGDEERAKYFWTAYAPETKRNQANFTKSSNVFVWPGLK